MNVMKIIGVFVLVMMIGMMTIGATNNPVPQQQQPSLDGVIVDSTSAELRNIDVNIRVEGAVEPAREAPLAFGVPYTVEEIFFREGDVVRAGDVIATLDIRDFDILVANALNEVARAENNFQNLVSTPRDVDLQTALASLDAAEAAAYAAWMSKPDEEIDIAALQIDLSQNRVWQAQLRRDILLETNPEFRTIPAQGINANSQIIQVENNIAALDSSVDIAQLNLQDIQNLGPNTSQFGSAQEQITRAEIALDNLLNRDVRDIEISAMNVHLAALQLEEILVRRSEFEIVAPFDGKIIATNIEVGALPPKGTPAVIMADTNNYTIEIEVDEVDVAKLRAGMAVSMTVDALPEVILSGSVTSIDLFPLPDEVIPTYKATITLDRTLEPIRTGMSVNATIAIDALQDAVVIPSRFVEITDSGASVVVLSSGEAQRVAVTIGRQQDGFTQILSGLQPGQQVVVLEENSGGLLNRLGGQE